MWSVISRSALVKTFYRYLGVGAVNTVIHWAVFLVANVLLGVSQALSNFFAFSVAVTFSYFANAAFTFKARAASSRYLMFVVFMGFVSLIVGRISDVEDFSPWFTLLAFSAISLLLGFIYSKWVVFR